MGERGPWRNRIVGAGEEPPDQLVANPANWRTHPGPQRDALRGSLAEVGWVQQVMVNRRTGFVVDGHARVEEALSSGAATVPVLYVDLDPEEEALVLATLDPIGAMATRDDAKLAELLADISVDDAGLAALLETLAPAGPKAGLTDPDDVPEVGDSSNVHLGDVCALGDHRLMCGDSTKAEDVARLMGDTGADLIVTSPPYNADIAYAGYDDDQDADAYLALIRAAVAATVGELRRGRFVAWNVGVSPKTHHIDHALILREAGLRYIREIVWAKSGVAFPIWQYTDGRARKYHPNYTHEVIFLFSMGEPEPGEATSIDAEYSRDVWEIHQSTASVGLPEVTDGRRPRKDGVHGGSKINAHPAMYPVAIPAGPIRHLTAPGEEVLDPFSGSGTTIIAAEQLGRRCYAMEIDPRYVAVAIERWENFTGRKSERVDG